MPKENSPFITWCDRAVKTSIFALVFLMPLFFGPWSYGVGDFNKQVLLMALSFIGLGAWMLKALVSGKFTVKLHPVHAGIGALVVAAGLSTLFSVAKYGSFWGNAQVFAPAFVSIAALAAVYFLVSHTFSKKDVETSVFVLAISVGLALVYGILQIFGLHLIPLAFAKNNSFNTIGSLGSFGFFAAVLMPLWIFSASAAKKWLKTVYLANIALAFTALLLINYRFLWIVALVASLVVIALWAARKEIFDVRWMFLPIFLCVVSLFFIALSPRLAWLPKNPVEVSLSSQANMEINLRAVKSLEFFGAGPANFGHAFAQYKNADFNQSPLWNVNFSSGASKVLTAFAEMGMIGFIALLLAMALPMWYGIKYVISKQKKQDSPATPLVLAIFAAMVCQTFGYFLYNANIALDFVYFFTVASLTALLFKESKEYALKPASLVTMAAMFIFVLVFIFYGGILFMEGQRYMADMDYRKALALYSLGNKDESLQYVKKAAQSGNFDMYFNQLALFSLARVQDHLAASSADNREEKKQVIQSLILDAINATNASVALAPNNYENWSTRAYVCQNLLGLATEAPACALQSYDRAIALNPNSAYLFLQEGNVYVSQALAAKDPLQKNDLLAKAVEKFSKAIELKPNYAFGYLQLAVALDLQQKPAETAVALQNAEKYSAGDAPLSFQVGLAYYQAKNWLKAQENFQRALVLIPKYANALYFSGLTYEKQGQSASALAQFSKILELGTSQDYIQKIINNLQAGKPALEGLVQQPPAPETPPASQPSAISPSVGQ